MGCGASSARAAVYLPGLDSRQEAQRATDAQAQAVRRPANAQAHALKEQVRSLQQRIADQNSFLVRFCSATCTLQEHLVSSMQQRHISSVVELEKRLVEEQAKGAEEVEALKQLEEEKGKVMQELDKVERLQEDMVGFKKSIEDAKESNREAESNEKLMFEEERAALQKLLEVGRESKVKHAYMDVAMMPTPGETAGACAYYGDVCGARAYIVESTMCGCMHTRPKTHAHSVGAVYCICIRRCGKKD